MDEEEEEGGGGQPPLLLQAKKIAERKIHSSGLIFTLFSISLAHALTSLSLSHTNTHIHTHTCTLTHTHTHYMGCTLLQCTEPPVALRFSNHRLLHHLRTRTHRREQQRGEICCDLFFNGALHVQIPFDPLARLESRRSRALVAVRPTTKCVRARVCVRWFRRRDIKMKCKPPIRFKRQRSEL